MEDQQGTAAKVTEKARALGRDARELRDELRRAAGEVRAKVDLTRQIQEHPIRTVLLAGGVGYIVGGGLASGFSRTMMSLGLRYLIVPLAKARLQAALLGPADQAPAAH